MRGYLLTTIVCLSLGLQAQITVGLLSYDIERSYPGYTLIYPHNQPNVYLLDNCGEIVHTWTDDSDFRPGNTAYLREDGSLVKAKRKSVVTDDAIWAGGGGAIVEIRSWENELLWSFEMNNDSMRLHHDIAPMDNGNILMLAWERKTYEEAIQAGRDSSLLVENELWPDFIFEIDPTTDEIVWEWHVWDHLIQDYDETKDNYGIIAENPRLVNLNWDRNSAKADWLHGNALDYNEELKQIMLSVPYFDELWIIDHTTDTEEAAGHFGGLSNRGGDLMYRNGNPAAYGRGDSTRQILHFQHDTHWSNRFLSNISPYANSLVCFNNRVGEDFSSLEIFDPVWNMYLWDYEMDNGVFLPKEFENTITHPEPQKLYSTGLSSTQLLPNGNVLACSGRFGYMVELTPENNIVWEYKTPLMGGNPVNQGTELSVNNNLTFRAFRYPETYEAFEGRDLEAKGFLELMPDEDYCERLVATHDFEEYGLRLFPNPAQGMTHLTWDTGKKLDIQVIDLLGRVRLEKEARGGMTYLDVSNFEPNIFFIYVDGKAAGKLIVQ